MENHRFFCALVGVNPLDVQRTCADVSSHFVNVTFTDSPRFQMITLPPIFIHENQVSPPSITQTRHPILNIMNLLIGDGSRFANGPILNNQVCFTSFQGHRVTIDKINCQAGGPSHPTNGNKESGLNFSRYVPFTAFFSSRLLPCIGPRRFSRPRKISYNNQHQSKVVMIPITMPPTPLLSNFIFDHLNVSPLSSGYGVPVLGWLYESD